MKKLSLPIQASIALVVAVVLSELAGVIFMAPAVFFLCLYVMGWRKAKPTKPVAAAVRDAALALQPSAGHGQVIVHRDTWIGMWVELDVTMDGRGVVRLVYRCSSAFELEPGSHTLVVAVSDKTWGTTSRDLAFDLAAGETVVIRTGLIAEGIVLERETDAATAAARLKTRMMVVAEPAVR